MPKPPRRHTRPFDAQEFLDSAGVKRTIVRYPRGATVFAQGDPATGVFYIQSGGVKLSVLSQAGKNAVVAILSPGDFFGEGCLAGQLVRMGTATALSSTAVLVVEKPQMLRVLHDHPALAARFLAHVLTRNIRIEEDLIDQLFNSSEKRLARALLLLARYGKDDAPTRTVPRLSQEILADMVGTTRSRVNFFLNKFRRLAFIKYTGSGRIEINKSLLSVVLHD
jgi:CRP/FNR family transcriptional regulator, cyclic AMP receptor protein